MESAREERAKLQLYNRFCQVLTEVREKDNDSLQDRKLAFGSVTYQHSGDRNESFSLE